MDQTKAKNDFKANLAVAHVKSSLPPKLSKPNVDDPKATVAESTVSRSVEPGDKQKHCIEILSSGFVQSFVDFFYLTHRPDPSPELYTIGSDPIEIVVPASELLDIRNLLTSAEEGRRTGDSQVVFNCYGSLASYYEDRGDLKTCLYFNEKCLELARLTHDIQSEMESTHRLGLVYDRNHDEDTAIRLHEEHLRLAEEVNDRKHMVQAHETLYHLYERKALKYEKEADLTMALDYYKKCLIASTGSGNEVWESLCNYRIGKTLNALNRCDESLSYLVTFLHIARRLKDMRGQGQACAALAAAHQALGQQDKAEEYLLNFLELAEALKDLIAQSDACYSLGVIYNNRRLYTKAVQFFTRNYDLLRSLVKDHKCDVQSLDNARYSLGMAKGNLRTERYVEVMEQDPRSLLRWKVSREDIVSS